MRRKGTGRRPEQERSKNDAIGNRAVIPAGDDTGGLPVSLPDFTGRTGHVCLRRCIQRCGDTGMAGPADLPLSEMAVWPVGGHPQGNRGTDRAVRAYDAAMEKPGGA